jgi:hypothetical protein
MRASSPSTSSLAFGVTASSTKWLSQCGQNSSLRKQSQSSITFSCKTWGKSYLSSNSAASLRKHFLHFLQAKIYPTLVRHILYRPNPRLGGVGPRVWWALPSPETSAAYGTPAPGGIRHSRTTCGLIYLVRLCVSREVMVERTARGANSHLGVEDVFTAGAVSF